MKIDQAFQTNAMLINDEWCDLFEQWGVNLGVSVDGPKHIHDAARKTRAGKGTYDKTIAGIKCLQRRNIPFYVISVLSKVALLEPDAMFEFYKEFDIRDVGFNIEEHEGIHKNSTLGSNFDDQNVIKFFARFSNLMNEHEFIIAIRELEEILTSIRALETRGPMNNLTTPFGIITIDVRGDVYTFSPELVGYSASEFPTFSIGNIFDKTFDELRDSIVLKKMESQITQGIELCRTECKYFRVCGGGAPSNKVFENGTFASTETMYCRLTKKRVTDFLLSAIETKFLS